MGPHGGPMGLLADDDSIILASPYVSPVDPLVTPPLLKGIVPSADFRSILGCGCTVSLRLVLVVL